MYHHHHVTLVAQISLTLSRHSSLSFIALGRSSGQHPVSSHSCWMYVRAGHPAFARPYVGVHKSTSLMSSSLLLQQCPSVQKYHKRFRTIFHGVINYFPCSFILLRVEYYVWTNFIWYVYLSVSVDELIAEANPNFFFLQIIIYTIIISV